MVYGLLDNNPDEYVWNHMGDKSIVKLITTQQFAYFIIFYDLYSLRSNKSYHQISLNIQTALLGIEMIASLCNSIGASVVPLPRCLPIIGVFGEP